MRTTTRDRYRLETTEPPARTGPGRTRREFDRDTKENWGGDGWMASDERRNYRERRCKPLVERWNNRAGALTRRWSHFKHTGKSPLAAGSPMRASAFIYAYGFAEGMRRNALPLNREELARVDRSRVTSNGAGPVLAWGC